MEAKKQFYGPKTLDPHSPRCGTPGKKYGRSGGVISLPPPTRTRTYLPVLAPQYWWYMGRRGYIEEWTGDLNDYHEFF